MKLSAKAARDDAAQKRIIKAAAAIAEIKGLDAPQLAVQARDQAVRSLLQREAIADFLESLLAAEMQKPKARARRKVVKPKSE